MIKLLTLGTLFLTAVKTVVVVVAKLVILRILFLTSLILALRIALVAKLVISGISSAVFLILPFYIHLFQRHHFLLHQLIYLKSTGTGTNLLTSSLSTLFFTLLKLIGTLFNLSISNLSTLDFKVAKSIYLTNFDVSGPAGFFKSAFV